MDAMEVLDACRSASRELASLRGRLQRLRQAAGGLGGHSFNEGIRSTGERDRAAAYIVARVSLEQEIRARERDMEIEEITGAMLIDQGLRGHDQHAAVMYAYYIRRESCKEISADMHLSTSRIRNLKAEGAVLLRELPPTLVTALLPLDYRTHREDDDGEGTSSRPARRTGQLL